MAANYACVQIGDFTLVVVGAASTKHWLDFVHGGVHDHYHHGRDDAQLHVLDRVDFPCTLRMPATSMG